MQMTFLFPRGKPVHIWRDGPKDGKPELLVPCLESISVRLYYKMENLHPSSHKAKKKKMSHSELPSS